jgi:hypothetical protein
VTNRRVHHRELRHRSERLPPNHMPRLLSNTGMLCPQYSHSLTKPQSVQLREMSSPTRGINGRLFSISTESGNIRHTKLIGARPSSHKICWGRLPSWTRTHQNFKVPPCTSCIAYHCFAPIAVSISKAQR